MCRAGLVYCPIGIVHILLMASTGVFVNVERAMLQLSGSCTMQVIS